MQEEISFGKWLYKQRRTLDLTRKAFADQIGCAEVTLRRIEAGTLKPSKELASILIEKLGIPESERSQWVSFARGFTGFPLQSNQSLKKTEPHLPAPSMTFVGPKKEQSEIVPLINQPAPVKPSPILQAQLFGTFSLVYDNIAIAGVNSARLQSLIAFLILHSNSPQSRQQVAFLFWPDTSEAKARNNLRQFLFQLRQTLPDSDRFLQVDTNTIFWKTDEKQIIDVLLFQQALKDADLYNQRGDQSLQRVALEKAVSVYQDDLLPGWYDEWIEPEREGLRLQSQNAHRKLIQILEMQSEYALALTIGQRLLNLDPLDEGTYVTLILLHALSDNLSAARRVYQNAVVTLQRELGVEPSEMLHSTYQRLQDASQAIAPQGGNKSFIAASFKLAGRQPEWQQLQAAWKRAVNGGAHLVLITGEAGIGKSRLAEELFNWVIRQGFATAYSRSYGVEGRLSLGPVTDLLRSGNIRPHIASLDNVWKTEIARLLPELLIEHPDPAHPTPISEYGQRQFFFEALARAIHAGQHPLLLWIDDLHWSDQETLEWLHFLLRFEAPGALFILGTARSEESPPEHPLSLLARQLWMEDKISTIELSPLDAAETAKLASEVQGYALEDGDSIRLFRETEGNPLFVVETVRAQIAGLEAVEADQTNITTSGEVPLHPPRVHAVIVGRLVHLSTLARNVAEIGAAIGRSFPLDLLLQGENEKEVDVIFALNELWQKRIIREQSANIFDFTHDKLREITYLEISTPKRRLLHRNIAQALQNLHADDLDPISGQLALHYERAGLTQQAVIYYEKAALQAQHIFAHNEATRLLLKALLLLETLPSGKERDEQELALQTYLGISKVSTQGYGAPEVLKVYSRAKELCEQLGRPVSSPILRALAIAHLQHTEFEKALDIGNQLLNRAEQEQDTMLVVEGHYILGVTLQWQGAFNKACWHLNQAIDRYDPALAHAHIALYSQDPKAICLIRKAWALACLGYPDEARQASQDAQEYALKLAHPLTRVYIMFTDSLHHNICRDIQKTLEIAEATIQICLEYQLDYWISLTLASHGWALAEQGDVEMGIAEMEKGISGFQAAGGKFILPHHRARLAEQYGKKGEIHKGLTLVNEAIVQVDRSGERWCEADMFRIKGELLRIQGEKAEAEAAFRRAIVIAQGQEAKLLELRAALSLARLWPNDSCPTEVQQRIASLYQWFSEGFDLPDLVAARAFLGEL
jgi:DNA-binding SARP family transcriptional activator/predicted ATPase/transcriptional regulator with XRE-family HTH domain